MTAQSITATHLYEVHAFTERSENVVQVLLTPCTAPLHYQAGQYVNVAYPSGNWLPLSIANAPRADHVIEFHIRHRPRDAETAALLDQLRAAQPLQLIGPFGHAIYQPMPECPIILLAGGTGLAPLKAILEQAEQQRDLRRWHLYWGARTAADFYLPPLAPPWQAVLQLLETRVISQPQSTEIWSGRTGYLHNAVLHDYPDLTHYQVYASGPSGMVAAAYHVFLQHGLPAARFYSDMI